VAHSLHGVAQPAPKPGSGERPAHIVSLHDIAPHLAECTPHLFILDSFGHDAQAQGVSKRHRRAHDSGVRLVLAQLTDERAVDLEFVDRQSLEE